MKNILDQNQWALRLFSRRILILTNLQHLRQIHRHSPQVVARKSKMIHA